MKFARYLQDTQTPEWKKAYIDYRGLKKRISAIRRAQQTGDTQVVYDSDQTDGNESHDSKNLQTEQSTPSHVGNPRSGTSRDRSSSSTGYAYRYGSTDFTSPPDKKNSSRLPSPDFCPLQPAATIPDSHPSKDQAAGLVTSTLARASGPRPLSIRIQSENSVMHRGRWPPTTPLMPSDDLRRTGSIPEVSSAFLTNIRRRVSWRGSDISNDPQVVPLSLVLPVLTPVEKHFFELLDRELDKIEDFYQARESEAKIKLSVLKSQLRELQDHRKLFHAVHDKDAKWSTLPLPALSRALVDRLIPIPKPGRKGNKVQFVSDPSGSSANVGAAGIRRDPDEYKNAKKDLKKAILEYYRGLEVLNNYRVLNLTGFRKALKKFEKVTKIRVQQAYMREKVDPCTFAHGETVEGMLKEMEDLFAARFENGDKKKARTRLRAVGRHKSHHFSTFRSGFYLGIALPALVSGLYQSFQPQTKEAIVTWDALLLVYATLLIPVLFSLLVGLNILVWTRSRINYAFIFELDVRNKIDSREYFELPSFLLSTLCCTFWFSFSRIGEHNISPTTWPIIWIVFVIIVMLNPFPILFRSTRWWLLGNIGKQLTSGLRPVEFADFWMGDQFCSLIFTLSNIYFIGCVYDQDWQSDVWQSCSAARHWGVRFAFTSIPLLVRTVQSIKRYVDSKLITHLINAGKYSTSILYYGVYYVWRHNNTPRDNYIFALYCIAGVCYSTYTCSWDLLMDWSLFNRGATYRFLRPELVYSNHIYMYYFAIVSNIVIRFVWVIFLPSKGWSITMRTFIAGMFEMLRRWQWNFYRLENEHIGNTDQYRVTREVPLPYDFDEEDDDPDDADEGDSEGYNNNGDGRSLRRRGVRLSALSTSSSTKQDLRTTSNDSEEV